MAQATLTMTLADGRAVPLSVLDTSVVGQGQSSADALRASTDLARAADRLGYARYWVAEHHNMASIASTSPPVLMAHLAARTERIVVGSGGVMLPNHSPLVVAEQFAILEALHPGRVDLGIGRGPGGDARTSAVLRRGLTDGADTFPEDLAVLLGLLGDERLASSVTGLSATPGAASSPTPWLLGSSGYSAQGAGSLGLPFAHAAHFAPGGGDAVELYRRSFVPSPSLAAPHAMVTASVQAADTTERARYEAAPMQIAAARLWPTGTLEPVMTPAAAAALPAGARPAAGRGPDGVQHVGTGEQVLAGLSALAQRVGADEVMVTTAAHDPAVRVRSLELLAQAARGSARLVAA